MGQTTKTWCDWCSRVGPQGSGSPVDPTAIVEVFFAVGSGDTGSDLHKSSAFLCFDCRADLGKILGKIAKILDQHKDTPTNQRARTEQKVTFPGNG